MDVVLHGFARRRQPAWRGKIKRVGGNGDTEMAIQDMSKDNASIAGDSSASPRLHRMHLSVCIESVELVAVREG
jgi:hypothetical protein